MIGVGAGSTATAQQMPPAQNAGREMTFGAVVAVVHDTNIAGGAAGTGANLQPADTVLRPAANFTIFQPVGRQALFLRGTAGYDFHQNNPNLDSQRVNLTGGGILRASACQATLTGTYSSARSELIDATNLASVSNQQTTTSEALGVGCGIGTSIGVNAQVRHQDLKNSIPFQKLADNNSNSVSGAMTYGRPTLGVVGLQASYSKEKLPNALNVLGGVGDGFANTSLSANYQRALSQKLNFNLGGGISSIKRDNARPGVKKSLNSFTYNAAVTYTLNNRMDFGLNTTRGVKPTDEAGKLYDIATTYGGTANYKLGARFLLGAGASLLKTKSNTDSSLPIGLVVTDARTNTIYGSIRYQQSAKASVTFDVRQLDRKTNVPILNYSDTRVSLTTAVNF
jgi:hypothetical protein